MTILFENLRFISLLLGIQTFFLLSAQTMAQQPEPFFLLARLQKTISTNERHTYQFEINTKRYVRFAINHSTARIILEVRKTNGQSISKLDCHRCDSVSMSALIKEAGVYQLSIQSNETGMIKGKYDIVFAENRPTTNKDDKRIAAELAFSEGNTLQAQWNAQALRKALNKYNTARLLWKIVADAKGQSRALQAIGSIYQTLGQLKKAQDSYQQAYILAGDDTRLKVNAILGLGAVAIVSGNAQEGVRYGEKALELSHTIGDKRGEIQSLFCIGGGYSEWSHSATNQNKSAVTFQEEALLVAQQTDDLPAQAKAFCELSYEYGRTAKRLPQAIQKQKEALAIWQQLNETRGRATSLVTIGKLISLSGEKQQALAFFLEAEPAVNESGEPGIQASLYNGLGFVEEALGDLQQALRYYLKALEVWQLAGSRNGETETLAQIGRLYQEMGESQLALTKLLKAKQLAIQLDSSLDKVWVSTHLGTVYHALGRDKEALHAYQEALDENQIALPWLRMHALNGTGKIYHQRGDYKEAIAWYTKALTLTINSYEPFGEVSTLINIARAQRDSGNLDTALKTLNEGIQKIEMLRTKMSEPSYRASYFATTRDAYELTIDILMRLSQRPQNHNFITKAFEISESARARSLLDILEESKTDITPATNPALLEEKRSLLSRITEKNRTLAQLYADASSRIQATVLEQELAELNVRRKYVESLIRAANPRYALLTQPEPSKLPEIQQLLDAETMLLEYSLGDDKSYLWIITADSITGFQLPSQVEIEKIARQVYESLIAPNKIIKGETDRQRDARLVQAEAKYPQAALRLSQMILAPVALITGKKKLVIVADGALQYIPFAALPIPQKPKINSETLIESDFHLLLKEYEIINLPSASTLAAIRRELENRKPAAKAVAVIADPVFNKEDAKSRLSEIQQANRNPARVQTNRLQTAARQLEVEGNKVAIDRLAFSYEEAMAILSIAPQGESLGLLNFQANKQTIMDSELNQYRFIHFATHGLLDSNHPELSKLILSLVDKNGNLQDGLLQLHEIYNLKLPVELVVLSACQTALGKEIKGEGLVGLTRGFMYAGAARVVASLWNVNDAATADLMSHFYKYMLQEKQRPAEALRNAQLKMLQQKKWKSPYYWAAFTIQGEWK
jgi:CHAT domain-containing protein/Tfp pilus assembly protein PilF